MAQWPTAHACRWSGAVTVRAAVRGLCLRDAHLSWRASSATVAGLACECRGVEGAGESGGGVAGQRRREHAALALVVAVGLREAALLDLLGDLRDVGALVALHFTSASIELVRRVDRVQDLLLGAPALARSLLEEPERVAVAVAQVADLRLLEAVVRAMVAARGGRSRLIDSAAMRAALPVCSGSKLSVMPAARIVHCGVRMLSRGTARRTTRRPRPRVTTVSSATRPRCATASRVARSRRSRRGRARGGRCGIVSASVVGGVGQSLAWSASLREIPVPFRSRASTAPVTLLRMNRMLLVPERSRALTTLPSGKVTLVPAVT